MGYSLKPSTMRRISDEQEPVNLDQETSREQDINVAMNMIGNGLESNCPSLIRKGICKLVSVYFGMNLTPEDLDRLAARRQKYMRHVDRVRYGTQ